MTTVLEENEIQNMFYSLSLGAFHVMLTCLELVKKQVISTINTQIQTLV